MKTFLILYCAFAYGYEFAKLIEIATGEDIGTQIAFNRAPIIIFFLLLLFFLFSPLTFLIARMYGLFSIIFNKYEGEWL